MKFTDILRGHVFPGEERIKAIWKEADFCLDSNILLDVYRYTDANREAFLKLLGALKGRLFIPNRVAVEFGRNRITVIQSHFSPITIIRRRLNDAAEEIAKQHPKHQLKGDLLALVEAAKKLVDDKYAAAEKDHKGLIDNDTILPRLLDAIGEEVGDPYPEKDLQTEYKRRKEGMIPPFCEVDDKKKTEDKSPGDVAIWLELMKQYEGKGKPLIFVTDDMKENWWSKSGGRHDPQPALVQEAYAKTKAEILFYSSDRFSELATRYLDIQVPKELIEETKQIRDQERKASTFRGGSAALSGYSRALSEYQRVWEETARPLADLFANYNRAYQEALRPLTTTFAQTRRIQEEALRPFANVFAAATRLQGMIGDLDHRAEEQTANNEENTCPQCGSELVVAESEKQDNGGATPTTRCPKCDSGDELPPPAVEGRAEE